MRPIAFPIQILGVSSSPDACGEYTDRLAVIAGDT